MASPQINEASEIRRRGRQRLIGAIALVALLVVFVPMLLDSEPRPQRNEPALAIPPKANAPALPAPPPAQASAKPAAPDASRSAAAEPAKPAKPEPVKTATIEPAKPTTEAARTAAAAAPKLEGFAVQVGAFRDEAKLAQARQKLAGAGIVHYTERLDTQSGVLTRLRAGPFATREAAEGTLASIKRAALDGKVVTLP